MTRYALIEPPVIVPAGKSSHAISNCKNRLLHSQRHRQTPAPQHPHPHPRQNTKLSTLFPNRNSAIKPSVSLLKSPFKIDHRAIPSESASQVSAHIFQADQDPRLVDG
ncbi:hypothetical protein GX50_07435 [[Emmonsia] crescens]|uniref:Uncharacterized protein n=1 Tax=[Emmonsia] crescens TaxID=73230 RepID=A0A2B7Z785_9EURO|nr:hypothetical protein GX50_07435 [Emmonsia crescens]